MDDEMENAYEVLGLTQGFQSTESEIKKAYRALALRLHPDKNPDKSQKGQAAYVRVQKAYELLTDKEARAALDDLQKAKVAREARFATQDAKRRKMREELEKRERTVATARDEEAAARAKLKIELARLHREAAQRAAAAAQHQRAAAAVAQASSQPAARPDVWGQAAAANWAAAPPAASEELLRSLKVSWYLKDGSYSSDQLRLILGAHGPVEDVVLREPKKKKSTGSAVVVMGTAAGAAAAAASHNGDPGNALLVVPFLKVAGVPPTANDGQTSEIAAEPAGAASAAVPLFPLYTASTPAAAPSPLFPVGSASMASTNGTGPGQPPDGMPAPLFPVGAASPAPAPSAGQPRQQATAGARPANNGSGGGLSGASSFRPPPMAPVGTGSLPPRPLFPGGGFTSFTGAPGVPPTIGSGHRNVESTTLTKMRQAAERARVVAELEAQDALERG